MVDPKRLGGDLKRALRELNAGYDKIPKPKTPEEAVKIHDAIRHSYSKDPVLINDPVKYPNFCGACRTWKALP